MNLRDSNEVSLTVKTISGKTLLALTWKNDVTNIDSVDSEVEKSVNRWIKYGLDEWIGHGASVHPRSTLSSDPEFLPRLHEYLRKQFRFEYNLSTSGNNVEKT